MSIWAYVGLPGQGKSYHAVAEQVLPALKQGRCVVTNIPLNREGLQALGGVGEVVQISNDALLANPHEVIERDFRHGAVVVLDELWRFLPQGLSGKMIPPAWASFFAEHRHRVDSQGRSTQIVLVTQDLSQLAAFARALVERTVLVTKMSVIGSSKRYRVDTYAGSVTGLKPSPKKRISEEYGTYDAKIFACYTSHTMAQGSSSKVDESVMSTRGAFWRHPMVKYGLPIAGLLFAWGLWRAYEFFFVDPVDALEAKEPKLERPVAGPGRSARSGTLLTSQQLGRAQAMRYRVAAIIRADNDADSKVLLDHCDGTPARWVPWFAARCLVASDGMIGCDWRGAKYEFHAAIKECRPDDEPRNAQIQWFPTDAAGSSESVSVIGGA